MKKFLIKKRVGEGETSQVAPPEPKRARVESFNADDALEDPGCRKKIFDFPPNIRDEVRRVYLQRGPCQPRGCEYPQVEIAGVLRRFNPCWYDKYPSWLEYSLEKNKLFCFFCYLFKGELGNQAGGDAFVTTGFQGFNKIDRLRIHVGGPSSAHNQVRIMCEALLNQNQSIQAVLTKQTAQETNGYTIRLNSSVSCIRYLLCQGLAFRVHDESENSNNRGNFLELLKFLAKNNKEVDRVVLRNAPRNLQLTSPKTQKQIVHAAAKLTTKAIVDELGNDFFFILVDESCDISEKEQMALVIRYVTKGGNVVEHFLGIVHVEDTSAQSLKEALASLLDKNKLNLSRVRGQGYDGASNMRGEFNGLKALTLRENQSTYYIHCFAHQLQLILVYIAKNNEDVDWFFELINRTLNVVGGSAKCRDILRKKFDIDLVESRSHDDLQIGKGLNQELGLKRSGDTRWESHYRTILNFISNFSSLIHVLKWVGEYGSKQEQRNEAKRVKKFLHNFDFVVCLFFMKNLLGLTNDFSLALQRKDQDIVNAILLVGVTKMQLQKMRDEGWQSIIDETTDFATKHEIEIPDLDERYLVVGKSSRKAPNISHLHRYRVEIFCTILDMQLQELNNQFVETSSELLLCIARLNTKNSFEAFDKDRLVRLATFYPQDFTKTDILALPQQLDCYIEDVRANIGFQELNGLGDLCRKMVYTRRDLLFPEVFRLVKLALVLPVATSSVERAFLAMNFIKNKLRNKMCDQWMNDCLVTCIERVTFGNISNESIMYYYQYMGSRRFNLAKKK